MLLVAALALALVLPGLIWLSCARHPATGWSRLAHAVGVSTAFWPVALLWTTVIGVRWTGPAMRWAVVLAAAAGLASWARGRPGRRLRRPGFEALALLFVLLVAGSLRVAQAHELAVPPWVDGYHHTLITQVIAATGQVPDSLRPYLPVDRFYYHFGFHALAAAVTALSDRPVPSAVLWTGQALNGLAALTLYALARRLVRHRAAAIAGAVVPASLFFFPSYFLSWGRYTQLAGLVVLPIAWLLAADAIEPGQSRRRIALAGLVAAGLLLLHYRVFVFFALGTIVLGVDAALAPDRRRIRLGRLVSVAAVGGMLVAPWVIGHLAPGARALGATGSAWFGGPAGVADVPAWLFTTGLSGWCIELAVWGVVVSLAMRRRGALALVAVLALALATVYPAWLGLPSSWTLPPFALAISAYLPVGLGIALLADAVIALCAPRYSVARASRAVAVAAVVAALLGSVHLRQVVNPETVIAAEADVAAARWIAAETPANARFLISTAHWHLGTFRGLDGGYWLPVLAGRGTSMPAALYPYGEPTYVNEVSAIAATAAKGDALGAAELSALMRRAGTDWVYSGPAAAATAGAFTPERLRRQPDLEEVYARDGVYVFRRLTTPDRGDAAVGADADR